jgi:hypothetical protein
MVGRLVSEGAIAIVIDGLSERTAADGRDQVEAFLDKFVPRQFIITSRNDIGGNRFSTVRVGPIRSEDSLDRFMAEHLALDRVVNDSSCSRIPNDEGVSVPATRRSEAKAILCAFFNDQSPADGQHELSIPPLAVRLATDLILKDKLIPNTYHQLIIEYVGALCPSGRIRSDDFLRAARCTARDCVEWETARVLSRSSERLRGLLSKEAEKTIPFRAPDDATLSETLVLDLLVQSGLLTAHRESVVFQYDPIAEFLAVGYVMVTEQEYALGEPPSGTGLARAWAQVSSS